jgi:hypothetical protein
MPPALERREDEGIDGVPHPVPPVHLGKRRTAGNEVGPMRLILGSFRDPAAEQFLLRAAEDLVRLRGRHDLPRLGAIDLLDEPALPGLTGDDGLQGERRLPIIEPELRFPFPGLGAVAGKAVLGKDGPDVAVEFHLLGGPDAQERDGENGEGKGQARSTTARFKEHARPSSMGLTAILQNRRAPFIRKASERTAGRRRRWPDRGLLST